MALQHFARRLDCLLDQVAVTLDIGEAQERLAALPLAEVLTGPAQLEVAARNVEAVGAFVDHFQPRARRLGERLAIQQYADALTRAAADAAAQLVQLRE